MKKGWNEKKYIHTIICFLIPPIFHYSPQCIPSAVWWKMTKNVFFSTMKFWQKKKFDLLSFSFHKCWPISFTSLDLDWKVVLYEGIDKVNSSENICICYSPSLAEERNMQINFLCHNFSVQAQLLLLHGCKKNYRDSNLEFFYIVHRKKSTNFCKKS